MTTTDSPTKSLKRKRDTNPPPPNKNKRSNTNTVDKNDATTIFLKKQLKQIMQNPIEGITVECSEGSLYIWDIVIEGPPGLYEGAIYNAKMVFPSSFPQNPPTFTFTTSIYHPNVFPDGKVCISILHDGNASIYSHEPTTERWRPVLGVEQILISIFSLFNDPNPNSPANPDAGTLLRENPEEYKKQVRKSVRKNIEALFN